MTFSIDNPEGVATTSFRRIRLGKTLRRTRVNSKVFCFCFCFCFAFVFAFVCCLFAFVFCFCFCLFFGCFLFYFVLFCFVFCLVLFSFVLSCFFFFLLLLLLLSFLCLSFFFCWIEKEYPDTRSQILVFSSIASVALGLLPTFSIFAVYRALRPSFFFSIFFSKTRQIFGRF